MARSLETTCPSCGAPVVFETSISVMVVCEYCDSTVVREDDGVQQLGKMAQLAGDASPLYRGIEGSVDGVPFLVVGRLQLEYEAGVWNEWFVRFDDDTTGWIGEAMGEYMVYRKVEDSPPVPPYDDLTLSDRLKIGSRAQGRVYYVSDLREAKCVAGEGELPFVVAGGYSFRYADLRSHSKRVATIDYSESPPVVFEGRWLSFDDLGLRDARTFDGWD